MNKSIIFTAIVMLAVGLVAGYWFAGESGDAPPAASSAVRKPLFYRNPMNPSVTSAVPAKDSMGMDYVAVYADDSSQKDAAGTVTVDPVVAQNIGVRTAVARRTSIARSIRAVARVDFNEEGMTRLHSKVEGWIEELRVNKTGEYVDKDDILLSI